MFWSYFFIFFQVVLHFFESYNDSLTKSKRRKNCSIYTYQSTGSLKASKKKPKDKNWNQIPARRLLNSWGDKSGFRSHLGVMSRYTRYTHVSYIQELNGGALQEDSKSSHHFYSIYITVRQKWKNSAITKCAHDYLQG